jgi:hypothetical protein
MAREPRKTKRDRGVYLTGPRKGQVRPSASTRRRRRAQAAEAVRQRELSAEKRLAQEAEREEVERAKHECEGHGGALTLYRLGCGRRERPESVTKYSLDSDAEDFEEGRLVALSREDVDNGRRYFREEYPEWRKEKYPPRVLAAMAQRSSSDVGKLFVEYHGVWYEAEAVENLWEELPPFPPQCRREQRTWTRWAEAMDKYESGKVSAVKPSGSNEEEQGDTLRVVTTQRGNRSS